MIFERLPNDGLAIQGSGGSALMQRSRETTRAADIVPVSTINSELRLYGAHAVGNAKLGQRDEQNHEHSRGSPLT
jgi:hypothetical protein